MQHLADTLVQVIRTAPQNPFVPEWIGVQSRGMKQWIAHRIARQTGICANIQFMFVRRIVDHILTAGEARQETALQIDEDFLSWAILKEVSRNMYKDSALAPVQAYVRDDPGGRKKIQLAMKLAKIFDDYLVYRPDMVAGWQAGRLSDPSLGDLEQWQSRLWQAVFKQQPPHLALQAQSLLKRGGTAGLKDRMPVFRISFFGISSLPPLFLHLFDRISDWMEIYFFLLVPSNQFFFDVAAKSQLKKTALKNSDPQTIQTLWDETVNPLLQSCGAGGAAFFSLLEDLNYTEPFQDLFEDPAASSATMLKVMQSDIFHFIRRKPGGRASPVTPEPGDASVSIHACHSPMREAQVVKDILLAEFESDPDLFPHDVIVMMPDIEAYAPVIEAVFSFENPLPYAVSDRKKRSESEIIEAFLKILSLKGARMEKRQVLDLLLYDAVARKFDIATDDIEKIELILDNARVLWGKDKAHRKSLGMPGYTENTWQFGLERLFMGMAMPENFKKPVNGVLPCESFEGPELMLLGKLAGFTSELFFSLHQLEAKKNISQWCDILLGIFQSLLAPDEGSSADMTFLSEILDDLRQSVTGAQFDEPVTVDTILPMLENRLDASVSQGNFLAGSITFCNIMPMRSIPYKIVVLMGMDEAAFPRKMFDTGFSLIKRYPKTGDRNERNDDRYVFLETLLSAQSKLVMTYTGMDIRDNTPLPPSVLVTEVMDTVKESFVLPKEYACPIYHPLHAFSERYFTPGSPFRSFSGDNLKIASALAKTKGKARPFTSLAAPRKAPGSDETIQTSMDEMIRFFRHPVQWFMTEKLDMHFLQEQEEASDREPYAVTGLEQYMLGTWLLDRPAAGTRAPDDYALLRPAGILPPGKKGQLEYERIESLAQPVRRVMAQYRDESTLEPLSTQIEVEGLSILVNIQDIRPRALFVSSFGRLTAARLLSGWISHLFLNLCAPEGYPTRTVLAGRDKPGAKKPVISVEFDETGEWAADHVSTLAGYFKKGNLHPLCFFCDTGFEMAVHLEKNGFSLSQDAVLSAMEKARPVWHGSQYRKGEKENRYASLFLSGSDVFESVDSLMASGFVQAAVDIFSPMLAHMRRLT